MQTLDGSRTDLGGKGGDKPGENPRKKKMGNPVREPGRSTGENERKKKAQITGEGGVKRTA